MKLPVYKGMLENKTTMGVPTYFIPIFLMLAVVLYFFLRTIFAVLPVVILFLAIKTVSKNDSKMIDVYFNNLANYNWLGF